MSGLSRLLGAPLATVIGLGILSARYGALPRAVGGADEIGTELQRTTATFE